MNKITYLGNYTYKSKSWQPNIRQLSIFEQNPQRLQIISAPKDERLNDEIYRYGFILYDSRLRLINTRFRADEIWKIGQIASQWDWHINYDGRPNHEAQLRTLINEFLRNRYQEKEVA